MSEEPNNPCRLCGGLKPLRQSHLIPRSVTVLLHRNSSPDFRTSNPILVSNACTVQTQSQFKDYLLCHECEQRFSDHGEGRVIAHCWRSDQKFVLREQILKTPVQVDWPEGNVSWYSAASDPTIDCNKIIYFAMSVFWRASVHTWRIPESPQPVGTSLGKYEEPIRKYLLEQAPFPTNVALNVRIAGADKTSGRVMYPVEVTGKGFHGHRFVIPGLIFTMAVGSRIPGHLLATNFATDPRRLVMLAPEIDRHDLEQAAKQALRNGVLL